MTTAINAPPICHRTFYIRNTCCFGSCMAFKSSSSIEYSVCIHSDARSIRRLSQQTIYNIPDVCTNNIYSLRAIVFHSFSRSTALHGTAGRVFSLSFSAGRQTRRRHARPQIIHIYIVGDSGAAHGDCTHAYRRRFSSGSRTF